MRKWLLAGVSIALAVGTSGVLAVLLAQGPGPGPLEVPADIVIPKGGTAEVAAALQKAGAIGSRSAFEVLAEATSFRGRLKAGEFRFPQRASLLGILAIVRTARPVEHLLTIPEGVTSAQIARILVDEHALEGEVEVPAEGSVLPQTYAFERGASRNGLVVRAQEAARASLNEAWKGRAPDAGVDTPGEAVIMASLVERETAIAAEQKLVARVFLNRLGQSMRLQSDPTVVYGVSGGLGDLGRALTRGDLQTDGPYNTYIVKRLPAGPICSPGLAALKAVLHPAQSHALYFVADGTGGHRFSDTLEEHERNVRFYRTGRSEPGVPK